jgi:hypothetical protein
MPGWGQRSQPTPEARTVALSSALEALLERAEVWLDATEHEFGESPVERAFLRRCRRTLEGAPWS